MYVTNKPATAIIIALAAFLIATLALACSSATPRAGDVNTDRAALAALYNATNGSSWLVDTNWLSNGPLGEWHGVSTDADGRVAELDLDGKQLSGPIPSELGNLDQPRKAEPLGQPVERADTVGTGQPRQLGIPEPPRQPVERADTVGTGQPRQPGMADPRRNQLSGPIPSELGNLANLQFAVSSTTTS